MVIRTTIFVAVATLLVASFLYGVRFMEFYANASSAVVYMDTTADEKIAPSKWLILKTEPMLRKGTRCSVIYPNVAIGYGAVYVDADPEYLHVVGPDHIDATHAAFSRLALRMDFIYVNGSLGLPRPTPFSPPTFEVGQWYDIVQYSVWVAMPGLLSNATPTYAVLIRLLCYVTDVRTDEYGRPQYVRCGNIYWLSHVLQYKSVIRGDPPRLDTAVVEVGGRRVVVIDVSLLAQSDNTYVAVVLDYLGSVPPGEAVPTALAAVGSPLIGTPAVPAQDRKLAAIVVVDNATLSQVKAWLAETIMDAPYPLHINPPYIYRSRYVPQMIPVMFNEQQVGLLAMTEPPRNNVVFYALIEGVIIPYLELLRIPYAPWGYVFDVSSDPASYVGVESGGITTLSDGVWSISFSVCTVGLPIHESPYGTIIGWARFLGDVEVAENHG